MPNLRSHNLGEKADTDETETGNASSRFTVNDGSINLNDHRVDVPTPVDFLILIFLSHTNQLNIRLPTLPRLV